MAGSTRVQTIFAYDEILLGADFIYEDQLTKLNLKELSTHVSPTQIRQLGIANCSFLSSLSLLMLHYPNFLQNMFRIVDNPRRRKTQIEVTLYDHTDPNMLYIFVLDATKVMIKGINDKHKHDLIYLLEKAFAVYRFFLQNDSHVYTTNEIKILSIYEANAKNFNSTLDKLIQQHPSYKSIAPASLRKRIQEINTQGESFVPENDVDKEIMTLLFIKKYSLEEAQADISTTIMNKIANACHTELSKIIEYSKEKKFDYQSALDFGHVDICMRIICGNDSECIIPDKTKQPSAIDLLNLVVIALYGKLNEGADATSEIAILLKDIFGSDSQQKNYYIECIRYLDPDNIIQLMEQNDKYLKTKPKPDNAAHDYLIKQFQKIIEQHPKPESKLAQSTLSKIESYVKSHVLNPGRRGQLQYSEQEISLFNTIHKALKEGYMVAFETGDIKKKTDRYGYKGILKAHAYIIFNCLESGEKGEKSFVCRHPWSHYIREYVRDDNDSRGTAVWKAKGSPQLSRRGFSDIFGSSATPPSPHLYREKKASLPERGIGEGDFELLLEDLLKVAVSIYICDKPRNTEERAIETNKALSPRHD